MAEFKVILCLAKNGGYSMDDALFWYGALSMIEEGISEATLESIFKDTPKSKIHKDWK